MSTDFRQQFDHVDVLKLEIGLPHPTAPNLIRFSPEQGAWGLITPVPNTSIEGKGPGTAPSGWTGGTWTGGYKLTTPSVPSTDVIEFYTEVCPTTPGRWCAGRLGVNIIDGSTATGVTIRLEFLNAAGTVLTVTGGSPLFGGPAGSIFTPNGQAPSTTVGVRMRVTVTRGTTGTRNLFFSAPMIVSATSSANATSAIGTYRAYVDSWVNLIAPAHSINIKRAELDVGTLTARILDATIDPAIANTIRPGRRIVASVATFFGWQPLFTGTLIDADVEYDLQRALRGDNRHAQITLAAVDNVGAIGARRMPYGVALIPELRSPLESAGVPWSVNNNSDQLAAVVTAVSIVEDATVLDQVAITRDAQGGYAWVDRYGVLKVWDKDVHDAWVAFWGRKNLLAGANPSFEASDISAWSSVRGTLSRGSTLPASGTYVLRYTSTDATTSGGNYLWSPASAAVVPGRTYTGSFSIRNAGSVSNTQRIMMRFYDSSGIPITPDVTTFIYDVPNNRPVRAWVTGVAPAGAVSARVFAIPIGTIPVGGIYEIDAVMITEGTDVVAFFQDPVTQSFSERQYSKIDLAFSARKHLINEVNIRSLEWDPANPSQTIEVPYGPFRDDASAQEWGPAARTFTVHGLTSGQISTLASEILTRNAVPAVRANSITLPILNGAAIEDWSLLELYDRVALAYEGKRYSAVVRITSIEHQITERGWLMVLTFGPPEGVAIPHSAPRIIR